MQKKLVGGEHVYVAEIQRDLAQTLQEESKLQEAESLFREALAMQKKLLGPEHPALADTLTGVTRTLLLEEKFIEAEPPAREALALREKPPSDNWETFEAQSLLGASLLGQKKYSEAEPLLLSGYQGLKAREQTIPAVEKRCLKDALQCLTQLYDATGKPEEAAKWKQELTARGL